MYRNRVIPCLLLQDRGLVKTVKFRDPSYIGDPVNAVKIFNQKEVDELVLFDICASRLNHEPDFELIAEISGECFMPLCYGGGIRSLEHARRLFTLGVEKVALNYGAIDNLSLITEIADVYGSQSVVGGIDCKKALFGGYNVVALSGTKELKSKPLDWAKKLQDAGAGEIFLNSVDRDGTMRGFDLALIEAVTSAVTIPVIACGGAGSLADLAEPIEKAGASAVSAGSLFVFHGRHRAVLINYPTHDAMKKFNL
jgi:imidazole glycerol-phosphate synthase subunit HisF